MTNLPRLELTEDPNKKNDFIIFRHQMKGKKVPKSSPGYASLKKISSKKTRKHRKTKTRKHKKRKSIFNLF